jgi:hypothetical protein
MTAVRSFSSRACLRQLACERPRVSRRLDTRLTALLEAVSDERVQAFLAAKPKASTIYLGMVDGTYALVLSIDVHGRVNARLDTTRTLQRTWKERNLLWDVVGVPCPIGFTLADYPPQLAS